MPVFSCERCGGLHNVPDDATSAIWACPTCQTRDVAKDLSEQTLASLTPPEAETASLPLGMPPQPKNTHSTTQSFPAIPGYELREAIGQGGMGVVFKAWHSAMSRTVALKVIRDERLDDPDSVRRFQREIRAAAQLNHPNIVRSFHADEFQGVFYLVMEYVEGKDLGRVVKERGPLPAPEACSIIRQAALGLQHAYERGLVHRDLKPRNLLLTTDGVIKVLDLGMARINQPEKGQSLSTLTQSGIVMGTADYMAPEQGRDSHTVDIRADLYGLGCTLYFLLTGYVPFPGGSITEKIFKHQHAAPTPIEALAPDVPAHVRALAAKLMSKWPAERYQTPAELVEALDGILNAPLPADDEVKPPISVLSGSRRLALGTALAAVLILVALGVWNWFPRKTNETPLPGSSPSPSPRPIVEIEKKAPPTMPPKPDENITLKPAVLAMVKPAKNPPLAGAKTGPPRITPPMSIPLDAKTPGVPRLLHTLQPFKGSHPNALSFSADGKYLIVTGSDNDASIRLLDPRTGQEKTSFKQSTKKTVRAVLSPDGTVLAGYGDPPTVTLWNFQTREEVVSRSTISPGSYEVRFSPDGRWLVWGDQNLVKEGHSKPLLRWRDMRAQKEVDPMVIAQGYYYVYGLAFSPDGKHFATTTHASDIGLWQTDSRANLFFKHLKRRTHSAIFSRDGKMVAFDGHSDKDPHALFVLSVPDGQEKAGLDLPPGRVGPFLFADKVVSWVGVDGMIRFIDTLVWRESVGFKAHEGEILARDVSPDGTLLATQDRTGVLKIWDLTAVSR